MTGRYAVKQILTAGHGTELFRSIGIERFSFWGNDDDPRTCSMSRVVTFFAARALAHVSNTVEDLRRYWSDFLGSLPMGAPP